MSLEYAENVLDVYNDISDKAPNWLRIVGYETFNDFALDLLKRDAGIVKIPYGYMVLEEYVPGVRVTVHPCFTDKKVFQNMECLRDIVEQLFSELNVTRIQIFVSEIAGHSIRKALFSLGFRKEALLQNYTVNRYALEHPLISSEVWVIFR